MLRFPCCLFPRIIDCDWILLNDIGDFVCSMDLLSLSHFEGVLSRAVHNHYIHGHSLRIFQSIQT